MITDNQIDRLFEEFEQVMDTAEQALIGLCVVINFGDHAHVLGIGPKEHIENIVSSLGKDGQVILDKREIN